MVNNRNDLRLELEQMATDKLAGLLQTETGKEVPDDDLVLLILDLLEGRMKQKPVELNPREQAIWKQYLAKAKKRARPAFAWGRAAVAVAATLVLVFGLMFAAMPQEAKAGSIFDVIARCTDLALRFFSPGNETETLEYEFRTEHPGLQKLHDTVVEYGYDGPAVPMWVPEEYSELVSFEVDILPSQIGISTALTNGSDYLVIRIDVFDTIEPRGYYKELTNPEKIEMYGTIHHLVKNLERYTVVWDRENISGCITVDCQENVLHKILKSIYVMEAT